MIKTTDVTEIERAACTLLRGHMNDGANPAIGDWCESLTLAGDVIETIDVDHHPNSSPPIFDYKAIKDEGERNQGWMIDFALYGLAHALVEYRRAGRPVGDQYTRLAEGIGIRTSLAAAVAEFHRMVVGAYVVGAGWAGS